MLTVTSAGDSKVTKIEAPNEMLERLKEAKKKNSKSVFSKLKSILKELQD